MAPSCWELPYLPADADMRLPDLPSLSDLLAEPSNDYSLGGLALDSSPGIFDSIAPKLWGPLPSDCASAYQKESAEPGRDMVMLPDPAVILQPRTASAVLSEPVAADQSGGRTMQRWQRTVSSAKSCISDDVNLPSGKPCSSAGAAHRHCDGRRLMKQRRTGIITQQPGQQSPLELPSDKARPASPPLQAPPLVIPSLMPPIPSLPQPSAPFLDMYRPAALAHTAAGKKVGRPRVYDTLTPVLVAAEVAAAMPPTGSTKRCRGAKPKYVCHTEQEAVAKRYTSRSPIPVALLTGSVEL